MADNVTLDPGAGGASIATDDVAGQQYQRVKLTDGTADSSTVIASGGGVEAGALRVTVASDSTGVLSVDDNGGSLTVDGTVTVQDGGGSLTVDAPVTTPAFVRLSDGAAAITALPVTDNGGSLTVDGTVTAHAGTGPWPVTDNGGSLTVDGTVATTNGGTFVTQENGAALTALQLIDNTIFVDDAAFTPATSSVSVAGFLADQASTDSVNEGDAGAARMTLDRKQIVTMAPSADTEGLTTATLVSAASTNATSVKASAGKVYGWYIYNDGAAEVYFKLYNKASAPTVGTDVPVITLGIPAGGAANVEYTNGIAAFPTGIAYAVTTGATTADTGAVALSQVVLNLFYQ